MTTTSAMTAAISSPVIAGAPSSAQVAGGGERIAIVEPDRIIVAGLPGYESAMVGLVEPGSTCLDR
jgi:hypothetical protein